MISTNLSTKSNLFEQGNSPNNFESPESSGTIFNAAKPFNLGDISKPVSAVNDGEYGKAEQEKKPNKAENRMARGMFSGHHKSFAYKIFEGALKNFTKIIWTSVPAEAIASSVTDTKEAEGYSKILERKYEEISRIKKEIELSSEETARLDKVLEEIKAAQLDPSKVHFNALANNIENTFADSFISKFVTDFSADVAINVAAKVPLLKRLNPIIIADYVAKPLVFIVRSITAEKNMSGNAFNKAGEVSEKQQAVIDAMSDTGVAKLINYLRDKLKPKVQPFIDGSSRYLFGITPGDVLKDKDGNIIRTPDREVRDEHGNIKIEKGEAIRALAKINPLHFAVTAFTSLFLTIFALDKNAQATGYQGTKNARQASLNMALNIINRLDTTLISNIHTAVRKGSSFLDIFYSNAGRKLIVPTCQTFMDALSNLLPGNLNPAAKAIFGRLIVDFTAPPFVQSFTSQSNKDAISHETQYVAHRFIKPVLIDTIGVLKNVFSWWAKNCYAALGIYPAKIKLSFASSPFWAIQQITSKITGKQPKDIPGLFSNDVDPLLTKELPAHLKNFEGMPLGSAVKLAVKRLLATPLNIMHWTKESLRANKDYVRIADNLVKAENTLLDLKAKKPQQVVSESNNVLEFRSRKATDPILQPAALPNAA